MTRITPTLTVILPNYNHATFLPGALEALLSQSFPPSELLIVDDASTDNSVEIIQDLARSHPSIRLVRNEKNMGASITANRGLTLANGDYLYFAAADDSVLPGFFEKSIGLLEQYPHAGLCSGISVIVDGERRYEVPTPPYVANVPAYLAPKAVLNCYVKKDWFIMGNTTIYRKAALNGQTFPQELGRFNDEFTNLMLSLHYGACFVPERLSVYHVRQNSFSSNSELDVYRQRRKAETLMVTSHAKFFPPAFVSYFSRLNTYTEAMFLLRNIDHSAAKSLDQFELLLKDYRISKRLILFILRRRVIAQKCLVKTILYFQLGRFSLFRIWRLIFF